MPTNQSAPAAPVAPDAAHCGGVRDGVLLTLVLFTLLPCTRALAGEQTLNAGRARPDFSMPVQPLGQSYSATEFRPRRLAPLAAESNATPRIGSDSPMFEGTTVWQRLADFKSQDRVRVLTLWETRGSTLSLQTRKHGGPSLQWSSPSMRAGASGGLLDRLFAGSLRSFANTPRLGTLRSVPESPKPLSLTTAAP
jgi:hypothetical protein